MATKVKPSSSKSAQSRHNAKPSEPNGSLNPLGKSVKAQGKQRQVDVSPVADGEAQDIDGENVASNVADLDKVKKRTHFALRQMNAASKTARKFEVQRLVKKLKSCSEAERTAMEQELQAIKAADLSRLAATALLTKLSKNKLLPRGVAAKEQYRQKGTGETEWPLLAGVWSEGPLAERWTAPSDEPGSGANSSEAKARAKLMSSKVLAEECTKMVGSLAKLLPKEAEIVQGPAQAIVPSSSNAETNAADDDAERIWSGSEGEGSDIDEQDFGSVDSESGSEDAEMDEEAIQEQLKQLGDLDQWDALIGDDSGTEEQDDKEARRPTSAKSKNQKADSINAQSKRKRSSSIEPREPTANKSVKVNDGPIRSSVDNNRSDGESTGEDTLDDTESDARSASDDDDEEDEEEEEEEEEEEDSSSGNEGGSEESHFLPSLSHGFLTHALRTRDDDFSGGESDESDIEEDVEDKIPSAKGAKSSKERRNRMGQRARKALWEKKYGRNANHLKLKEKEKRQKAASGTDGSSGPYKPLRRGRNGQVLPEFVKPETQDAGWKKFPVAADAAPESKEHHKPSVQGRPDGASGGDSRHRRPLHRDAGARPARPGQSSGHQAGAQTSSDPMAGMHPSWVAKQKQKEREEAIAKALAGARGGAGAGAGKKVVFD